jgi:sec-independent protein translocase protein TatC
MASALRAIGHEDRLSLVEHLAELRARLIVCGVTLAVAFGVCFWQNHALLRVINRPLEHQTQKSIAKGNGPLGQTAITQQALLHENALLRQELQILSGPDSGLHAAARSEIATLQAQIAKSVARVPRKPVGDKPVTLGIGEPFTQTVTISFFFALLFALPMILFQLYGFVLPAFSPTERSVAMPLMVAIPILFVAGVLFGYFVVLAAAVRFFQNFNSGSFNVVVQASAYYHFAALLLLAMGVMFQVPVGILAAVRAGVITPRQLRKNRRYAIVIAAVIAALLPGDAITMMLETLPLIVLYEASILVAAFFDRRARRARGHAGYPAATPAAAAATAGAPAPSEQYGSAPIPPTAPPTDSENDAV